MQSVLFYLRVDELIHDKKPRPAVHPTTPAGVTGAIRTWVQQNKTAMAAIRSNTDKSYFIYVPQDVHHTAESVLVGAKTSEEDY